MGIIIAGIVVIATFLLSSSLMFGTFFNTSVSRAKSLKDLTETSRYRTHSGVSITNVTNKIASGTDMTAYVKNSGSESVTDVSQMDVFIEYTDAADAAVLTRLTYDSAAAGDNEWTIATTGVQPNSFNPDFWDSDETLPIDFKVSPAVKSSTSISVIVSNPWGVTDETTLAVP